MLFVLYTAFEVAAAQWAFTLFTEGRGLSEVVAGLAVTGFYAALTAARLLLGGSATGSPAPGCPPLGGVVALAAMAVVWLVAAAVGRAGGAGGVRLRPRPDLPAADGADPGADRARAHRGDGRLPDG